MREQSDYSVVVEGHHVPVVAFFGTKGGVGKTTITDKFSTLVARGACQPTATGPNVLLVDFDIYHRGLTVTRTRDHLMECRTIHEYLADDELNFQGAQDVTPTMDSVTQGREYLIPSSAVAADKVFGSLTRLQPLVLVDRILSLLRAAASQYHIELILVDCGPIVDPLTASAAFVSDMAFIIGQNEPITVSSLTNYPTQIREFLPKFDARRVRVILNKVRGPMIKSPGIYAAIPFTMEVVDYSEGLTNIDEIRLIYLDFCVYWIVKAAFEKDYPQLVPGPEAVLTTTQKRTVDLIDRYPASNWYRRLKTWRHWLATGCSLFVLAAIAWRLPHLFNRINQDAASQLWHYVATGLLSLGVVFALFGGFLRLGVARADQIIKLKEKGGYGGLLALLTSRDGRKKFDNIQALSDKTEKEAPK